MRAPLARPALLAALALVATSCNSFLFQENLMPRLQRLGLISDRIAPRYREIGLLT